MRNDNVIIFGSNGFQLSLTPLLVIICRLFRTPCYVQSSGGSLDEYTRKLIPPLRWWLLHALRTADGLIVETDLLRREFVKFGVKRVHFVPGYRSMDIGKSSVSAKESGLNRQDNVLRLVFVGHVRKEKGIFVLTEAMRILHSANCTQITCDIYGPAYKGVEAQLKKEIESIHAVTYRGVLKPEDGVGTLRNYDMLVFPTFYQGEGHPGVVIEAMMAGIPSITTNFRAIPEVVHDNYNGLLVPVHNPAALADAILLANADRTMVKAMAAHCLEMRKDYDTSVVIPQIMAIMGIHDTGSAAKTSPHEESQRPVHDCFEANAGGSSNLSEKK